MSTEAEATPCAAFGGTRGSHPADVGDPPAWWMVQMARDKSEFHWCGTFALILAPGLFVGALIDGARPVERTVSQGCATSRDDNVLDVAERLGRPAHLRPYLLRRKRILLAHPSTIADFGPRTGGRRVR